MARKIYVGILVGIHLLAQPIRDRLREIPL